MYFCTVSDQKMLFFSILANMNVNLLACCQTLKLGTFSAIHYNISVVSFLNSVSFLFLSLHTFIMQIRCMIGVVCVSVVTVTTIVIAVVIAIQLGAFDFT